MAKLLECCLVTLGLDGHVVIRLLVPATTEEHLFHEGICLMFRGGVQTPVVVLAYLE